MPDTSKSTPKLSDDNFDFSNFKIAVIDDSLVIRNAMKLSLSELNVQIETFADPVEAVKEIIENPVDLILTDFEMPIMNGLQVIQELRKAESTKKLPILILTGIEDENLVIECLNAGATDYLLKRANQKIVITRISNILKSSLYAAEQTKAEHMKAFKATVVALNHEFNNTMQTIALTMSRIERMPKMDPKIMDSIQRAKESMKKLNDLLVDIRNKDSIDFTDYDSSMMVKLASGED